MAITRRWQAGAEVDTTNSDAVEFDSIVSATNFDASNVVAHSGSYAFRVRQYGSYARKGFTATKQIRMGFWWYPTALPTGQPIICRTVGQAVTLKTTSGTNGLDLAVAALSDSTASGIWTVNAWQHIGIDIKSDGAAGWAKVYVDGQEVLSVAGNTGGANLTDMDVGNPGSSANHWSTNYVYYDDIYIDDTTGEAAAPAADLRFEFISPNGVGNYSVWDPFPGGGEANWQDVDERPNDGDTTYVEAQILNERDSYTMTTYAMAAGWAIEAVIPTTIAKKTDGGTDTEINLMTRQGGVDDDGSDQNLPTSYGLLWDRFPLDPGGGPWSQADLDSVECGYRGRGTF